MDGVPVLSGIDTAGLEVDTVCRVTRTEREGQGLCGELEFSCKLSFCQDTVSTWPGTIVWANPGARDFEVGSDVLGGESLNHGEGREVEEEKCACMVLKYTQSTG